MKYIPTGIEALDKVLNGGVVLGNTLLVGGPYGVGATTLLLQVCQGFAREGRHAFFASGEMTLSSIQDYAKRVGCVNKNVHLHANPEGVLLDEVLDKVSETKAKLLVVDSIMVTEAPNVKGDIGQTRMMDVAINILQSFGQRDGVAVLVIDHLNKDDSFVGSSNMLSVVDGIVRLSNRTMYQDGRPVEGTEGLREISMDKARQGPSNVTAFIEMTDKGFRPPSIRALRALKVAL